mgnify:CR=1 FL=1
MSKKEQENNSSKGESFHDSQTESESVNINQNLSKKENNSNNNNNIIISDKEQNLENNDNIAYDKRLWNLNEELNLRKEQTNESKLSIDTPDISKQKLKEYLNEDLLNALDVSPMVTPKNILKNAANENNNDINNNENIITPSEDMMNGSNSDLFQFSLYNNNNSASKELYLNKNENVCNNNPIDELIKISENNEDKIKNENQKDEEDYNDNEIMYSFSPPNFNINSTSNDLNKNNEEINIIKEDEGGGNNINLINNLDSPNKQNLKEINNNINKKDNNIYKFSKEFEKKNEIGETRKNNNNTKTYLSSQAQHPFIPHLSHFQYPNQQHLIQTLQQNIHENKFDGKKFNLIIPIQTLKKNQKMKKPFEIREGDWTCSDCSNLNFAFRVKCNRCGISKEVSEQKRINNNNEQEQGNNNIKDNLNNSQNYYSNVNMMPFKRIIFQSPLCNKGETFYPKYCIYVPFQGQYVKNIKDKKNGKEESNCFNKEKDKENITNDKSEQ